MKNGNFVKYKGMEYEFFKNMNKNITMISYASNNINIGFTYSLGKYIKTANLVEISDAYSIRTYGSYKGYDFSIRWEENEKYHLEGGYNHDIMTRLEFEMIERGVYRKWVNKDELERVWEEKTPLLGFNTSQLCDS